MNKQQVLDVLVEEMRTNSELRRKLNIEEGMEVSKISPSAEEDPVGISWGDHEGTDVALQVFTSADDYGPYGG